MFLAALVAAASNYWAVSNIFGIVASHTRLRQDFSGSFLARKGELLVEEANML